jgi:ABC-2 type transport system ATP-binding protein
MAGGSRVPTVEPEPAGSLAPKGAHVPSAISTTDLTKHYPGFRALEGLSIEVPQGSIYGFLGANGAGKTTALKILAGLSRPTTGSATVAGVPLAAGESYKRAIGFLGQEPRFYDWMTARQALRYVAGFYPWVQDPIERRIDEALELTGITAAADRPTRTYSGGMRQRLGIAQTLIGRPQVLLLDEPASALDPIGRRDVLDLMEGLRGQATIFYSTHILDDVQRVSDHVAILDHGRLVRAAPTQELLSSFTRDRVRVVVGRVTDFTAGGLAALPGVASVQLEARDAEQATFMIQARPGQTEAVQRAVTRYAVESDLTLVANAPEKADLEEVFLRLIDSKERAA